MGILAIYIGSRVLSSHWKWLVEILLTLRGSKPNIDCAESSIVYTFTNISNLSVYNVFKRVTR